MSRQARQRSATEVYHVIQRGIDRMAIFYDDDDRQMFLNLLSQQVSESFKVYCYCLMDNHFHLIVKSNKLSFHIHHIASVYAGWFNHKHERRGYLFQDRFKSEAIEEEGYLLRCFRYILHNPLKAGLCKTVSSYNWSSYHAYYNAHDSFICSEFLPLFFDRKEDFEAYICSEDDGKYMDIDRMNNLTDNEVKHLIEKKSAGDDFATLPINVQKKIIKELMGSIQYAPTGGNKRKLEFTIIDDCKEMDYFRLLVRDEMIKLANNGIYPQGFDKTSYNQMMAWEKSVRPDSIFCGAPHILIPHAPKKIPCAVQDVNMAAAYFELLCNANGLGAICMSYPLAVLGNMPNVMKLLQIPEDHYISLMVGFGYPEIRYARGVQREANGKIKRIVFTQD